MFRTRRRPNERTAALEVSGPKLRLVTIEAGDGTGRFQVRTRSVEWRREALDLASDQAVEELGAAFRTLAGEENLEGSKLAIALGGAACFTWSAAGKSEDIRRGMTDLEERTSLYITLGRGEKVTASNAHPLDSRREHLLVSIAPQRILQ